MSLFNIRAFKAKQLTSKLAVAGLLASGLTVAPFFAGAVGGYTVPARADVIQVVAVGGSGGGFNTSATGGKGCELSASFAVTEGDTFSEVLGGNGEYGFIGNDSTYTPGGAGGIGAEGRNGGKGGDYNFLTNFRGSGAGGGGATSVYRGADEVMISGGGGGGSNVLGGGHGCAGNTLDGGAGYNGLYGGGGGGTSSAGGYAGAARGSGPGIGLDGVAATGNDGADAQDANTASNGFAAGGGGGYFGGGSGASSAGCCLSAGGGAGSSWAVAPPAGIKAPAGKAATATSASVSYYAVNFPTQTLPAVENGVAYSADLSATFKGVELNNGTTAIWTVSPALPSGLSLNAATGAITGTATSQVSDDYEFKAAWKSGTDIVARSFQTIHLAVSAPPTTPGAPVLNSAVANLNGIDLSWTAPTSIGGSAITDYYLEYSTDGGSTWTRIVDEISTVTSADIIGLLDYTSYKVRVLAVNNDGPGTPSNEITVTTLSRTPGAPSITNGTVLNTNVTLEWTPPTHIGDSLISDYVIEYSSDGGSTWTTYNDGVSTETTATLRNLQQLTDFQFRVSAVNQSGTGLSSSPYSATTGLGVPGQVSLSKLHAFGTDLELSWTAPEEGGAPITDYIVEYSVDGGDTWIIFNDAVDTTMFARIEGLVVDKIYYVRVAAVNELGTGDFSAPLSIRTRPDNLTDTVTPTPTPTETNTPSPTPTSTKTPKPTPTPTKTVTPKPKPSSTPTATASPSVTPSAQPSATTAAVSSSVLDVLAKPYKPGGTIVELDPSKSIAYENGAAVPVKLVQKPTKDGYILDGTFFDLELAATTATGDPVELDDQGNLVLEKDRYTTFSGTGFAPNTPVQVWLFSTPTKLKRVTTDANGNFSGSALVPASIPVGQHTVQLNGVSEDGKVRSVSLGVIVDKPTAEKPASSFDWASLVMWSIFGLLLVALFWWFIIARRRKSEEEKA